MQLPYLPSHMTPLSAQPISVAAPHVPGQPPAPFPTTQISYQHMQQQHQQQLEGFWMGQMQEAEQVVDFKNHQLPLARIKKIMKADEDVRMISAEAPVLFAKACEMFILELTLRSWIHTEENKRRTLQKNDIAAAITRTDIFDFLVDIVPRDDLKEEGLGLSRSTLPVGASGEAIPYGNLYYVAPQAQAAVTGAPMQLPQQAGMVVGRSAMPTDATLYAQQQGAPLMQYMPQQMWQQLPATNSSATGPPAS
ncbi:hypothetical protein O6H91_Y543600 [Diphasiastrum complanatum]|nr:hypothetical protein O6H91_Y543600 [Diphasiastrum complanatum]